MLAMNLHGQFPIAFNREQVEPKPPAGLSDKANEDKPLARFLPWLDNTARKKRHALIQITRGPTRLEVENLKDIGIYLQQPLDRHTYTIVLHPEKTGAAPLSTLMYEQTFFSHSGSLLTRLQTLPRSNTIQIRRQKPDVPHLFPTGYFTRPGTEPIGWKKSGKTSLGAREQLDRDEHT
ncbi:MAG: hypothetical protein ACI9QL_003575 [Candidatus Omnitrophota bacterium]|jgi:hypothetical protein